MATRDTLGGIIHTYQKYDPQRFPSPTQPPPDLVSSAFEHLLMFGQHRELTDEELARAIRLDPSQIQGLGPSLDALLAILKERKRKILERFETRKVRQRAHSAYVEQAQSIDPPKRHRDQYRTAIKNEQLRDLQRLWYAAGDDNSPFARTLMGVIESLGNKYEVEELAARYEFTGREAMTVPLALEVKEELEKIDELIKQLEEARETAQIGIIDMEALAEFAEPGDIDQLSALQQQIQDMLREMAEQQGLEQHKGQFRVTPKAYRIFKRNCSSDCSASWNRHARVGIKARSSAKGRSNCKLPRTTSSAIRSPISTSPPRSSTRWSGRDQTAKQASRFASTPTTCRFIAPATIRSAPPACSWI
jgi:hypothetical protein